MDKESGWALVAVLWVLTFLAMMAAAIAELESTSARFERRALDDVRLQADINAGLARAVLAIGDSRPEQRWPVDGASETFVFEGDPIRIAIQSEAGRIDLNGSDPALLQSLFQWAGLASPDAEKLSGRVVDWRTQIDSADDNTTASNENRERLARDDDYPFAGKPYKPRHGSFQSVSELRLVLGMTPGLYARIAPALTVYAHNGDVDASVAPEIVKDVLAQNRQDASAKSPSAVVSVPDSAPGTAVTAGPANVPGQSFSISITAAQHGQKVTRTIIVLLTGNEAKPYLVEAWQ